MENVVLISYTSKVIRSYSYRVFITKTSKAFWSSISNEMLILFIIFQFVNIIVQLMAVAYGQCMLSGHWDIEYLKYWYLTNVCKLLVFYVYWMLWCLSICDLTQPIAQFTFHGSLHFICIVLYRIAVGGAAQW